MTTPQRSTAAALFLLFGLVSALLVAVIVPTALRWAEDGRTIRASRERVAAVGEKQVSFARIKNATDRWYRFVESPGAGFLTASAYADTPGTASTHIAGVAARHGGVLDRIEAAAGETKRGQVETVTVKLALTLPKDALAPFLAELESAPPYTFIRSFRVSEADERRVRLTLEGRMQRFVEASS